MAELALPSLAADQLDRLEQRFAARPVVLAAGGQVSVRECGSARDGALPLVCLHGIGSGSASWLEAALLLSGRTRVIAWDAPGYGASTPLSMEAPRGGDYARRLHALLDAMGIRRCVLVGHSLGALMAAPAVRQDAERFAALALISPARGYGAARARPTAPACAPSACKPWPSWASPAWPRSARRAWCPGTPRPWRAPGCNGTWPACTSAATARRSSCCAAATCWRICLPGAGAGGLRRAGRGHAAARLCRGGTGGGRGAARDRGCRPRQLRRAARRRGPMAGWRAGCRDGRGACTPTGKALTMNSTEQALPDGDESGDRYNVPALERGLRVLGEFSRDTRTLTAPELARRFKLPRSTVFRLLATLESLGFVERDAGAREYRLGLAVLRLGFEYLASLPLNELGHPLLERLSKDTGHACNLIVRDGRSIVYVSRVSPPSPFVSAVSVGTRLPAHATVLGRVLMADLTLPELRALYPESQLESFSPSTPRTVTELFDLAQAIASAATR
jgi:DNA-binding IclR family transcriptional regulator/pimeloyl-ACP methyl ester carboxylesterase